MLQFYSDNKIKYKADSYINIILDTKLTSYITKNIGGSVSHLTYNLVAKGRVP